MKFTDVSPFKKQHQITTWVNTAKHQSIVDITSLLQDESTHDPHWFITGRGLRLKQLVDEIFTLKLMDVSNHKFTEQDFEGKDHSLLISKAIAEVVAQITTKYKQLSTAITSKGDFK